MTPTTKFRYVERDSYEHNGEHFLHPHRVQILQQWWIPERNIIDAVVEKKTQGEWRDIPLEVEA
jgi:hypothetical protein